MIVNERDVFKLAAPLMNGGVVNDKAALFEGVSFEAQLFRYLQDDRVHKGAPPRGVALESVKGVLMSRRPLMPLLEAKTMNGWYL